jgi:CheY-like chemotaxis protein
MGQKKVMMVDDEEAFLEIMSSRIESWGYKVISATNGYEALELFNKDRPDAVIIDFKMPEMDGVQLLMKIRAIDADIPVIMFTARPKPETMEDAKTLNISAFVPKLSPFVDAHASLRSALNMVFKTKGEKDG